MFKTAIVKDREVYITVIKAKLIRYTPLEMVAIFCLAKLYLKNGIGSVYVMRQFGHCNENDYIIYMHELTRAANIKYRYLQNDNSCPQWDSNSRPLNVVYSVFLNIQYGCHFAA